MKNVIPIKNRRSSYRKTRSLDSFKREVDQKVSEMEKKLTKIGKNSEVKYKDLFPQIDLFDFYLLYLF